MSKPTLLELIILVMGVIIFFASRKLPAVLRSLAKGIREFKGDSGYVEIEH